MTFELKPVLAVVGFTPDEDNHGFAKWVEKHADELVSGLGEGRHYGEWWGSGIQRGYGLAKGKKRFSLFNIHRWADNGVEKRPKCCDVVPVLYKGDWNLTATSIALMKLQREGSRAAPGFMNPEGIVIFHTAGNLMFKKTIEKDQEWKGKDATVS